jgi:hypothetical protein
MLVKQLSDGPQGERGANNMGVLGGGATVLPRSEIWKVQRGKGMKCDA